MTDDATKSALEMYAYHGQLGLKRTDLQYCSVVQDEANPDVWSSNKAFAVRASSTKEIGELMQEVDEVFGQLPYRHFVVDPLTPESFEAYLVTLPDFRRRGLASKVISHCVDFCRKRGADRVLIGSHRNQPPKHLYRKLGFEPAFLTRDLIKHT